MSTISGSLATLSMRRRAASEHGGREDVLGRADAGEVEPDVGARQAVGRLGDEVAVRDVHGRAEGLEPGGVQVETARADRVTAGHGDVGHADPGDERAEHRDRGPQGADELVVGAVPEVLGTSMTTVPGQGS